MLSASRLVPEMEHVMNIFHLPLSSLLTENESPCIESYRIEKKRAGQRFFLNVSHVATRVRLAGHSVSERSVISVELLYSSAPVSRVFAREVKLPRWHEVPAEGSIAGKRL
jgi:hypothetical protein